MYFYVCMYVYMQYLIRKKDIYINIWFFIDNGRQISGYDGENNKVRDNNLANVINLDKII